MHTLVTHAGVIHVQSLEELVDVSQILFRIRELPRKGAAMFTESGAFKALTLDLCEQIGLELPSLSPAAELALREALPAFIPPSNPLDLTAHGLVDPGLYRRTLPAVLEDPQFGSVVLGIILTDPTHYRAQTAADIGCNPNSAAPKASDLRSPGRRRALRCRRHSRITRARNSVLPLARTRSSRTCASDLARPAVATPMWSTLLRDSCHRSRKGFFPNTEPKRF